MKKLIPNREKWLELLFFLLSGGFVSTVLGKNIDFDTRNYHYYNPWALLRHRLLVDGFPASLQTLFNPVGDFPFYEAAKHLPDDLTVFLMGMPLGLALYLFWNMFGALDADRSAWHWGNRVLACVLAVSGAACLSQANSATGEVFVSALVLWGMSWLLRVAVQEPLAHDAWVMAGLTLGVAAGLKLTALVPVLAVLLGMPVLLFGKPGFWRGVTRLVMAMAGAFLVCAGPWMVEMYIHFKNPLFPFFNRIFHSPLIDMGSMRDTRFLSASLLDFLDFPMTNALVKNRLHAEIPMRDPRLLIGAVTSIGWLLGMAWRRFRGIAMEQDRIRAFLAVAFLAGYAIGMVMFGIYRYMIFEEFLVATMIFMLLADWIHASRQSRALWGGGSIFMGCMFLTVIPQWGSVDATGGRYFGLNLPKLHKNAMVVSLVEDPIGYLIPDWPGHPPVLSPLSGLTKPGENTPIQVLLARRITAHAGPVYVLSRLHAMSEAGRHLLQFYQMSVVASGCQTIVGAADERFEVCPVQHAADERLDGFDAARSDNSPFLGGYFPIAPGAAVWMGKRASVNFSADDLGRHAALQIDGLLPLDMLHKAFPEKHAFDVTVTVNGFRVASSRLLQGGSFHLDIPTQLILQHGDGLPVVSMDMAVSAAAAPAEVGTGSDVRMLGALIQRIVLVH